MKDRRSLIIVLTAAVSLFFFAVNAGAETEAKKGAAMNKFVGAVMEADCKTGELKLSGKSGEAQFKLTDKTEFQNIKGCEDIKKDGRALIEFSESENIKTVTLIKYRPLKSGKGANTPGGEQRAFSAERKNLFMGLVISVSCEKGTLTLQKMDDKSKTTTFALDKGTIFSDEMKECNDIKTSSIVAISYENKGDDKVVKTLKSMSAQSAPGRK